MSYIDAISSGREETTHTLQTTAPFKAIQIIKYSLLVGVLAGWSAGRLVDWYGWLVHASNYVFKNLLVFYVTFVCSGHGKGLISAI